MNSLESIEKQVISHVHLEYGEDTQPVRDWLALLLVAGVLLAISIGWNVWTYVRVVNGEAVGGGAAVSSAADTKAIDAVQGLFEKRAAEEANYRSSYHFVDPSK